MLKVVAFYLGGVFLVVLVILLAVNMSIYATAQSVGAEQFSCDIWGCSFTKTISITECYQNGTEIPCEMIDNDLGDYLRYG